MKIAVIGTGYVGLVTGTCFAEMGNDVWCVDVDQKKVDNLKKGIIPIFENGLEEMVKTNVGQNCLKFTTKLSESIEKAQICFIAVGTPMTEDGSADLQYVLAVAKEIGQTMCHHMYIVDKSTVPVGTGEKVAQTVQKELDLRGSDLTFDVISNPEFLKEGNAVTDCMKPDRIVIGVESEAAKEIMAELYKPYVRHTETFIIMDVKSAEMTKYTANAMLATKISFMNEIANICERVGADVNRVREGIGSDKRIGYHFIYPGCGYGGSCFPKDVQALLKTSTDFGYQPRLLQAVEDVNADQKHLLPTKIKRYYKGDLKGKVFAIWGLAFKPDTDDMRESPSISIIKELLAEGASVQVYDPKAMEEAKSHYLKDLENITYFSNKYDVLNGADAVVLVTEWKEFRSPDFYEMEERLKEAVIFDGRNQYDSAKMNKYGFTYCQIGVNEGDL
ncbi:MAG: UDP-glucose/GDP-mannose dehydrogenase family protein [Eubacteriales bacterium]